MKNLRDLSPRELRSLIRQGKWKRPTAGLAMGYAQANLVVLPAKYGFDFLLFCQRNPKPCPLLEVLEPGTSTTAVLAAQGDVRTDIPRYMVYRKGAAQSDRTDIKDLWQDDFIAFLLGCSFSFEEALVRARIPVRHIEEGKNVPMYITSLPCAPAGIFRGPMVVTMRPLPPDSVVRAIQITSRYPFVHGGPVHIGDPKAIGISSLMRPDFGDPVTIGKGEVPVFWACGVTPQAALIAAEPEVCITHAPGHMFITDILNEELATG
jgi:uncharacterized protein YcsI (UPF0317 family)